MSLEIIEIIFKCFVAVLGVIITSVIVPVLKEKNLYNTVYTFVKAAEEIYGSSTGEQKKAYVVSLLTDKGVKVTPEVDALIESCVKTLDITIGVTNEQ